MGEPTISVEEGKLAGKCSTDIDGNTFYSFQGIPYAKPPVGKLRFKAPEPPEPWSGVRDATQEGNICYSPGMLSPNVDGSEDCLFLNVYTRSAHEQSKTLAPVMVWIHGGGFRSGSGNSDFYGPEYLMTEDIVLVTINYRLGILGFLHLEEPSLNVSGNAGLKDMVMALKWVKRNIRSFGGRPDNVTIFGESAGGVAVHYLVLSPLAKGLFHKAIIQSGVAVSSWPPENPNVVPHFTAAMELKHPTEEEIFERLQALSIEELYEIGQKAIQSYSIDSKNDNELQPLFGPVIEQPSANAFLPEQPIKIVKSGKYNHVPLIFGYNNKEAMIFELKYKPEKPSMPKDFEEIIPPVLQLERGSEDSKNVADKIKMFYYGNNGVDDAESFYKINTDNIFVRATWFSAQHHVNTSKCPVYLYRMSADTNLNVFKKLCQLTAPGATHGDELGYLFKNNFSPEVQSGSLEELCIRRFVKYWTNFAIYGNPNSKEETNSPEWKPVGKKKFNWIDIGEDITAMNDSEPSSITFWRQIYRMCPLYSM